MSEVSKRLYEIYTEPFYAEGRVLMQQVIKFKNRQLARDRPFTLEKSLRTLSQRLKAAEDKIKEEIKKELENEFKVERKESEDDEIKLILLPEEFKPTVREFEQKGFYVKSYPDEVVISRHPPIEIESEPQEIEVSESLERASAIRSFNEQLDSQVTSPDPPGPITGVQELEGCFELELARPKFDGNSNVVSFLFEADGGKVESRAAGKIRVAGDKPQRFVAAVKNEAGMISEWASFEFFPPSTSRDSQFQYFTASPESIGQGTASLSSDSSPGLPEETGQWRRSPKGVQLAAGEGEPALPFSWAGFGFTGMGLTGSELLAWGRTLRWADEDLNSQNLPYRDGDKLLEGNCGIYSLLPGVSVRRVAMGRNFALASDVLGSVYTWGANASGQLGTGDPLGRVQPTRLGLTGIAEVAAAEETSVAWGRQTFVWGKGMSEGIHDQFTPRRLDLSSPRSIAVGDGFALGLCETAAYFWGANHHGQASFDFPDGRMLPFVAWPAKLTSLGQVFEVRAGANFTIMLGKEPRFWVKEAVGDSEWVVVGSGDNNSGQLANRVRKSVREPTLVWRGKDQPAQLITGPETLIVVEKDNKAIVFGRKIEFENLIGESSKFEWHSIEHFTLRNK